MKNILSTKQKSLTVLVSVLASVLLAALSVFAATTIGTNITTGGSLSVTGTSTLTGAVTSAGNIIFGSDDTATTEARFLELTGGGTNYVGMKAPDAITANVIWTLPSADGSANQTLVTNGSGVLSWASGLTTALTSGNIFVGNADIATSVAMSGDAALSDAGALTIASDAVTVAKIAQGTAGQILMSNATPDTAWITITGDVSINSTGVTTIGTDKVALTTDTTGNYVASLAAGNGIAVGTAGEGATPNVALGALTADWNQTGAFDISLNNSSSELKILEAGETPTLFGIFDVADLATADKTYTFPDATGTVALTSSNVASATALAANPTDCDTNQFANAIADSGNLTCSALVDADVPDTITASNYLPLSGGTLTGNIAMSGAETVDSVDISAITAMKSAYGSGTDPADGATTNVVIDQFQVTAGRTLSRIDGYCGTAYADNTDDAEQYGYVVLYNSTGAADVRACEFTSGTNAVSCSGLTDALATTTNYQIIIRTVDGSTSAAVPTAAAVCNFTLHLEQK